jgi:DNA mismatch repair ATPase MutS
MAGKPTYNELEQKIKQLEKEVLEYIRKAKELNKKRKITERSHIRRTISLMHINEELNREIKELRRSDTEELGLDSHRLRERIKELNCLYDISSLYEVTRPLSNNLKGGYHISCPYGYVGRGRVRVVTHGLNLPRHGTETARR